MSNLILNIYLLKNDKNNKKRLKYFISKNQLLY